MCSRAFVAIALLASTASAGFGQSVATASRDTATLAKASAPKDKPKPRWRALHVNEFMTPWTSFRIDVGILPEIGVFDQNAASREQVARVTGELPEAVDFVGNAQPGIVRIDAPTVASTSTPGSIATRGQLRDTRVMFKGKLATTRSITWQTGLLWDWNLDKFLVRQTGFVVAMPEIYSIVFIGRTKEGPSLNRVMIGYDGWTMERFAFSGAIPLLADGFRWQGYIPRANLFWNLGYFVDYLSEGQSYSYFDNQVAGRVGYLRMDSDSAGRLWHFGLGFHHGIPNEATLRLKSKPEANEAPDYVDTGKFPATQASLLGIEAYYRTGSWLYGTEYYAERAESPQTGNPVFHGGDIFALLLITGETRGYVVPGSQFREVLPVRSVFEGGPGAWEAGLRLSNIDLDAGTLRGGKYWRLTPVVNWYLNQNVRLELEYGYGVLSRFGTRGITHFFQSRLQLKS